LGRTPVGGRGSPGIVRDFHKSDVEGVEFSALIMLSATSISQPKDSRSHKHSKLQNRKHESYSRATQEPFFPVYTDTDKAVALF